MKYRMYHLVMYNISPIQQSIQSYHAGMEYAIKYWKDKAFQHWLHQDKTIIILNGGTSCRYSEELGTMELHLEELIKNDICCSRFLEPDLNYCTSAIAFLVPETVWDKEMYPDWETIVSDGTQDQIGIFSESEYIEKVIGGKHYWLRQFLSQFKLA